jgi:hypothetical protein
MVKISNNRLVIQLTLFNLFCLATYLNWNINNMIYNCNFPSVIANIFIGKGKGKLKIRKYVKSMQFILMKWINRSQIQITRKFVLGSMLVCLARTDNYEIKHDTVWCHYCLPLLDIGVIIFDLVRFFSLKNNQTGKKKKEEPKPNRNRSKPTGFSSVWVRFLRSKTEKTYGFFFSMTEMCLSSALNLLPQNLINIIKGKKDKEMKSC